MTPSEKLLALKRSSRRLGPPKGGVCDGRVETYSRVTGFYRPAQHFNAGKQEEMAQRRVFRIDKEELNCERSARGA